MVRDFLGCHIFFKMMVYVATFFLQMVYFYACGDKMVISPAEDVICPAVIDIKAHFDDKDISLACCHMMA